MDAFGDGGDDGGGDGFMLNRTELPRIQNERCKKMGIEFEFEISLTGLIYEGQQVVGVQGTDNKTKQPFKKNCWHQVMAGLRQKSCQLVSSISPNTIINSISQKCLTDIVALTARGLVFAS